MIIDDGVVSNDDVRDAAVDRDAVIVRPRPVEVEIMDVAVLDHGRRTW